MLTSPLTLFFHENRSPVETQNFLSEKYICRIQMRPGIAGSLSQELRHESIVERNALNLAALIQQGTTVKTRISESLSIVSMSLKKAQFSRLMNI